jgi:hypothetical protein
MTDLSSPLAGEVAQSAGGVVSARQHFSFDQRVITPPSAALTPPRQAGRIEGGASLHSPIEQDTLSLLGSRKI